MAPSVGQAAAWLSSSDPSEPRRAREGPRKEQFPEGHTGQGGAGRVSTVGR